MNIQGSRTLFLAETVPRGEAQWVSVPCLVLSPRCVLEMSLALSHGFIDVCTSRKQDFCYLCHKYFLSICHLPFDFTLRIFFKSLIFSFSAFFVSFCTLTLRPMWYSFR